MNGKRGRRATWIGSSRRAEHVLVFVSFCAALVAGGLAASTRQVLVSAPDPRLVETLTTFIRHEMADKGLPAVSIALVDGETTVWQAGFGRADERAGVAATEETIYRVGSVSKLFTDIAVMRLVERGEVDLDAPVTTYLPELRPRNPFGKAITLRQLMAHRSGLVREPPRGNYFDPSPVSLAETVASLNETELVYEPGTRTKYSNAGIAVVGYVLERTQGEPFARVVRREVLEPMGLRRSAFEPDEPIRSGLAKAFLWSYDGRWSPAPTFDLGMAPAGSLYAPVTDLARLPKMLFRHGRGERGRVLARETLERMLTPQFAPEGARTGYGLGFALSELDGRRLAGHGGAIYGFATQLSALVDERLGAVVVTNVDVANTVVRRIADEALRAMLALREGAPPRAPEPTEPVGRELARRLVGRYRSAGGETVEIVERRGEPYLWYGAVRERVRRQGSRLLTDGRLDFGTEIEPAGDGRLRIGGAVYERVPDRPPPPAPDRWRPLIGEYGWDHNTLYILEREGRLHALIEWFFLYPLEERGDGAFAFPRRGLYDGERLVFRTDAEGRIAAAVVGGVAFPRRPVGDEPGASFRIEPVRPVDVIEAEARRAAPPREAGSFREPELVELVSLDPTIRLDIRYATARNFLGTAVYREARAFLQRPAAEALVRAHRRLKEKGFGLLVHDAYRPWYVTKMFWEATPPAQRLFVADPSQGSRHNRGAAVDLTLVELATGAPVEMVSGYDEFTPRAYADYPGGTARARWHRDLLRNAMEAEGFSVYPFEWWHFDYRDWKRYPILNVPFEELAAR